MRLFHLSRQQSCKADQTGAAADQQQRGEPDATRESPAGKMALHWSGSAAPVLVSIVLFGRLIGEDAIAARAAPVSHDAPGESEAE